MREKTVYLVWSYNVEAWIPDVFYFRHQAETHADEYGNCVVVEMKGKMLPFNDDTQ